MDWQRNSPFAGRIAEKRGPARLAAFVSVQGLDCCRHVYLERSSVGQQLKSVTFKLTAAGVVAGRVRDSNGEPVGRVQVALLRTIYSINGQRNFSTVGSATTDDRGDYRIFWVQPGRYIVSGSSTYSGLPIELLISSNSFSDRTFPPTYYPGTSDPTRATTIDLQPGAEVAGIDFILTPPKAYRIRGKIVDSTTGQPPRSANISIT